MTFKHPSDKYIVCFIIAIFLIGFQICFHEICFSENPETKDDSDEIKSLAIKITGSDRPNFQNAVKISEWLNREFSWVANDYKKRSVEEIIKRKAGHCGEQAMVLKALLTSIGIKCRDIREINIHPVSQARQLRAGDLVKKYGFSLSVFGLRHNDHRWLEVFNESKKRWEPIDPTTGIIGLEDWEKIRVSFSPRPEIAKDLLVPFFIRAEETGEDRTKYYLIDEFNLYYGGKLNKLRSWGRWCSLITELSKHASSAFDGSENLHDYNNLIEETEKTYNALREEAKADKILPEK